METIIKVIVCLKLVCLVALGLALIVAIVYTTATEEPPRPDQLTFVCNDGDVQPPSLDREGCLHHGGLDHTEDGRR